MLYIVSNYDLNLCHQNFNGLLDDSMYLDEPRFQKDKRDLPCYDLSTNRVFLEFLRRFDLRQSDHAEFLAYVFACIDCSLTT